MAEDLGEEWWERKTKNSKNDKIEDEGEFFSFFPENIFFLISPRSTLKNFILSFRCRRRRARSPGRRRTEE